MKLFIASLITILFLFQTKSFAETEASIATGTFFESNTYYRSVGPRADAFLRVKPGLKIDTESESIGLKTDLTGSYNKYIKFANQDFFDYQGVLAVPINQYGTLSMQLDADTQYVSEPATTDRIHYNSEDIKDKEPTRVDRQIMGGGAHINWRMSNLSLLKFKVRGFTELYSDINHTYLDNQGVDGSGYYDYQFLPETVFYVGGEGGVLTFPKGTKNKNAEVPVENPAIQSQYKNDSVYYGGRAGVRGRLAERTRVDASGALMIRAYSAGTGFSEPVFNLKVEEQFSPKDLLMAGFDYDINDSKYTNYVIDQTTYLGYARILGDQILLLGRMEYTYSSYSKPYKREDQRLGGSFKVDYSVNPKSKISALLDLDILNSDQINTFDYPGKFDPTFSYEYFKLGLEYTQYF